MSRWGIVWTVAGLSLLFAQCAPADPDSLRRDPGASGEFVVNLPLKTVYANEQRGFLACMTGWYYTMRFAIQPRIDEAHKSASIVLVHHGAWKDIWAVVDMKADKTVTTVHAYTTGHALMKDFPDVSHGWATGDFRCQQYSITTQQMPFSE